MGDLTIFAGGFGSGKTEVALNFALERAAFSEANKVILADLDLVNPFFTSRELKTRLEQSGVRLVGPSGELSFGDVPHLPQEIIGIIGQDNEMYIDLAGDEVGSLVLGYLSHYVKLRKKYDFFMVLNPFRPFACNLSSVMELKALLEAASRLKITGIVSNPNMVEETDIQFIADGHAMVQSYADAMQIPVKLLVVEERFYEQLFPLYGSLLKKIKLYLRPDWLHFF
ncbi:MAG: hypothetical protein ABFD08_20720 [Syntrophomonas sp.]